MFDIFGAIAGGWEAKSTSSTRFGSIDEIWYDLFGQPSKAGVSITWQSALKISTALACTQRIAEGVATPPIKLYYKAPGSKDRVEARDHPLYDLLAAKPNDNLDSLQFRESSAFHVRLAGNGYCWLNKVRGSIVEIVPFIPEQFVKLDRRRDTEWVYSFRMEDGTVETFPTSEIWHVRGPAWNGYEGLGAVKLLREAFGLAIAEENAQSELFANGVRPSGLLSFKGMQSAEGVATARAQWEKVKAGGTAVLDGEATWQKIALAGAESQTFEARNFQVVEICRGMGVMPIMVGHNDKTASYASSEQMFLAHLVHCVRPWHRRYKYSGEAQLLTREERRAGYSIGFVDTEFLRGDSKARSEYYKNMVDATIIAPEEPRVWEDLPYMEGLSRPRMPLNAAIVGTDGLPIPTPNAPAADEPTLPAPDPSPAPPPNDDDEDA